MIQLINIKVISEGNMRSPSNYISSQYRDVSIFVKGHVILTAVLLISCALFQVKADEPFQPNVRVNELVEVPPTAYQFTPDVAIDSSGNIYVVWYDGRIGNYDIYFANSTDGGDTFSANKKINDDVGGAEQRDPKIAVDDAGNIYIVWTDHRDDEIDIYFTNSSDGGNTFSTNIKVNNDIEDGAQIEPSIAVDGAGNIYVVWKEYRNGENDIYFAKSTDGGNSFSASKRVNDDGIGKTQDQPSIAVDSAGNIYIAWRDSRDNYNWDIYFANSTDGGQTFSSNKRVNDFASSLQYEPSIALDSIGNIYIAWEDDRNGDYDIYFSNSTDGGNTFSPSMKINDDSDGVYQYYPSVAGGGPGNVYITWMDPREGSFDIYFTRSVDGGDTFSTNKKINDDVGSASQSSPSIAVDEAGKICSAWRDERNGNWDIYFSSSVTGGTTFSTNIKVNDDIGDAEQLGPSIAVDSEGNIYCVWMDQRNGNLEIYFANSSDGGSTFSGDKMVGDAISSKRYPSIAVDDIGNIYMAWDDYRNGIYDIYFANSTDGGQTFSTNKRVNDDPLNRWQLTPSVAAYGLKNVYIAWMDGRNHSNGTDIYLAYSTDGGNTFSENKRVNDGVGVVTQSEPAIAVDNSGTIYLAWTDNREGDDDIYFAYSNDGGNTFSINKKVTDDGTDAAQSKPSIAVDNTGSIYVAWQDEREGGFDIYFASSIDDGNTFSENVNVNDNPGDGLQFDPVITADSSGNIYIAWRDYRDGNNDIYFTESIDSGNSFSTNIKVNDDLVDASQLDPSIAVDAEGMIYIAWADTRNGNSDIYLSFLDFWIFDIRVSNITDTTATITWKSSKPANSTIEIGFSNAYGSTIEDGTKEKFHSTDLTGLEPGRLYHFRVSSFNDSTFYSISREFTFSTKFPIELKPGWNMISLPLNQTDTNLGKVLESINGSYNAVQCYDVTNPSDFWKHNHTSKTSQLNDLTDIDRFMGIWIHCTNPLGTTLYINGTAPEIGYVNQITLFTGWNFIGYPSLIERAPDSSGLPVEVDTVMWYNASSGLWERWDPGGFPDTLDILKPGQGLWIHYTGATNVWSLEYVN
jgi:hypothetical protein